MKILTKQANDGNKYIMAEVNGELCELRMVFVEGLGVEHDDPSYWICEAFDPSYPDDNGYDAYWNPEYNDDNDPTDENGAIKKLKEILAFEGFII